MEDKIAKKSESAFGEPYRVRQNKTHEFFYCCRCHRDRRTNPIYYADSDKIMSERHSILRAALDNGLLTKAEILSHLDYLIRRSRNQAALNTAVEKWKDDREYVRGLSKNAEGVYYEAGRIVHRRYNRVIK